MTWDQLSDGMQATLLRVHRAEYYLDSPISWLKLPLQTAKALNKRGLITMEVKPDAWHVTLTALGLSIIPQEVITYPIHKKDVTIMTTDSSTPERLTQIRADQWGDIAAAVERGECEVVDLLTSNTLPIDNITILSEGGIFSYQAHFKGVTDPDDTVQVFAADEFHVRWLTASPVPDSAPGGDGSGDIFYIDARTPEMKLDALTAELASVKAQLARLRAAVDKAISLAPESEPTMPDVTTMNSNATQIAETARFSRQLAYRHAALILQAALGGDSEPEDAAGEGEGNDELL